jgi:hypothetical protein
MTDDSELRAAIVAYLRAWGSLPGEPFPREVMSGEGFEKFVEAFASGGLGAPIMQMFRMFHDKTGRYPTFEELHPPGSPSFMSGHPAGDKDIS